MWGKCLLQNEKQNLIFSKMIAQRRQWHPTPVLLPRKSHERRSLEAAVHGVTRVRHD